MHGRFFHVRCRHMLCSVPRHTLSWHNQAQTKCSQTPGPERAQHGSRAPSACASAANGEESLPEGDRNGEPEASADAAPGGLKHTLDVPGERRSSPGLTCPTLGELSFDARTACNA